MRCSLQPTCAIFPLSPNCAVKTGCSNPRPRELAVGSRFVLKKLCREPIQSPPPRLPIVSGALHILEDTSDAGLLQRIGDAIREKLIAVETGDDRRRGHGPEALFASLHVEELGVGDDHDNRGVRRDLVDSSNNTSYPPKGRDCLLFSKNEETEIKMPSPPRLSFTGGTLVLENMAPPAVQEVFGAEPWVWDRRVSAWRCDALEYLTVRRSLGNSGLAYENTIPQWSRVPWPKVQLPTLRPEQSDAVAAWKATGRGVLVMPTGTGKTEVALSIMQDTALSTLVVAPVRDLMYQWHRRILQGLGYDAGVIGDNVFRVQHVSVTTYDSACIHMERLGCKYALVIFDESHHLPGDVRRDAARMAAAPWRLGLTATHERSDGRHQDLDRLIGPVVYRLSMTAVRGQTLADYEVVRIPVYLSDQEQARYDSLSAQVRQYIVQRRKTEPTFSWQDLCGETGKDPGARQALKAFFAKKAIEDRAEEKLRVLEDIFRLHAGSPTLIFAGSNAMARDVSRRFLIPCLLNHCGKKERLEVLTGLQDRGYPALVCNQVLDEGVDVPEVKVAVVIGGTASTRQAKQRLGRILRKTGNARATLYEVVCADTNEENRSRRRRGSDAYQGTRHRRL
jgi:superfamily II DNA or RNA helicase